MVVSIYKHIIRIPSNVVVISASSNERFEILN